MARGTIAGVPVSDSNAVTRDDFTEMLREGIRDNALRRLAHLESAETELSPIGRYELAELRLLRDNT